MTNRKMILGIILGGLGVFAVLIGIVLAVWASMHSPHDYSKIFTLNHYYLKEPYYTIAILVAWGADLLGAALAVLGGILFISSLASKPQRA